MGWRIFYIQSFACDIVDVTNKQLPTNDIVVNMDGGVGGSWKEVNYIEINGQKLELQHI